MADDTLQAGSYGLETADAGGDSPTTVRPDDCHRESTDHLGFVYGGSEAQFQTVAPFVRDGLVDGERCLYIAADNTQAEVIDGLRAHDVDVDAALESGQLSVRAAAETYLETGSFDRDAMEDWWRTFIAETRESDAWTGVRAAAEMTWALESEADLDDLATYEAELNDVFADEDCVVMCQYNRERFPTQALSDVIYTHPRLVYEGVVSENDNYRSSGEFLDASPPTLDPDRAKARLLDRQPPGDVSAPRAREASEGTSILPLIADPGNRQIVVEWLADRFAIVDPAAASDALADGDVDLVILDAPGFERHRDVLTESKTAQEPCILPVLMLHERDEPLEDPDARQAIDDVLVTPSTKQELAWRIESLLGLRAQSMKFAEMNERLEYLVSSAAHDLRNPLQIARAYALELEDDPRVRRIRNATARMEHLIENLLTIRRTEADVSADSFEYVGLESLVRDCWDLIHAENARLEMSAPGSVRVRVAPDIAKQLFENLFRNAVEHGGDSVTIRVGTLSTADGVYVEDDGPGIPPAERETVFEAGQSSAAGNGLGLSIVTRIAESHGWNPYLTESEGGGARFEFTGVDLAR